MVQLGGGLLSRVFELKYFCKGGCNAGRYVFWAEVNVEEGWVRKVGQLPMWLPEISKELEEELGEDSELYKKALRNMNEGYGIGACAYLRRLLEKYINPLLQLLHDTKQDQGAGEEELLEILRAIDGKDFTTKSKFAAEIAPASIVSESQSQSIEFRTPERVRMKYIRKSQTARHAILRVSRSKGFDLRAEICKKSNEVRVTPPCHVSGYPFLGEAGSLIVLLSPSDHFLKLFA